MQLDQIDDELREVAFLFFFSFSRFEFALKANGFLQKRADKKAMPDWQDFTQKFAQQFIISPQAIELISLHPNRQVVSDKGQLKWKPVGTSHCPDELSKVVTMIKTVRNNLFHGGKFSKNPDNSRDRNARLMILSREVLDQLARLSGLDSDYHSLY